MTMSPQERTEEADKAITDRPSSSSDDLQASLHNADTSTMRTIADERLISFLTGMRSDLEARLPLYLDDWGAPRSFLTVLNATIFAFVIQLIPALIFGELIDGRTDGSIGTAEVLLSTFIMGVIYAVFAGQPLVLMGITGPVAVLLGTSYGLADNFDAEYFPFFFWICMWAGLMHIVSAMAGLVSLVWKVTPFTTQIFELFIAVEFIYSSVRDLAEPIYLGQGDLREDRSQQYASLVVGVITCFVAWTLHFADTWTSLTKGMRTFLSSYNTLVALVVGTAFSYLPGVDLSDDGQVGLERVNVKTPWDWKPTADRSWIVSPFDGIDASGILAAAIPGLMFFFLFIIDHNVSSIMTQSPRYNLKKPSAYHWDFFILGITFIPCALMGLPPGSGLIPQAPLHCRALCTRKHVTDAHGVSREVVTHCEEQRWSGLGQSLLMLVALTSFEAISWIPRGCLFGLFLYLGMGALNGNEIWERFILSIVVAKRRPAIPVVRNVEWKTVQAWTLIQGACALAVFAVAEFASVGYLYPALLMALVPLRSYVLERMFSEDDLYYLDPTDETEDEYQEEQKEYQKPHEPDEDDSVAGEIPHMGQFHPGAISKELRKRQTSSNEHPFEVDVSVSAEA